MSFFCITGYDGIGREMSSNIKNVFIPRLPNQSIVSVFAHNQAISMKALSVVCSIYKTFRGQQINRPLNF